MAGFPKFRIEKNFLSDECLGNVEMIDGYLQYPENRERFDILTRKFLLVANVVSFPGLSRCCFVRNKLLEEKPCVNIFLRYNPAWWRSGGVDASASCRPPPSTGFGALFGGGLSCLGLPPPPTGGGLEASLAPPLPPAPTSHSMLCSYIPDCKQLHCNQNRHRTLSSSVVNWSK